MNRIERLPMLNPYKEAPPIFLCREKIDDVFSEPTKIYCCQLLTIYFSGVNKKNRRATAAAKMAGKNIRKKALR